MAEQTIQIADKPTLDAVKTLLEDNGYGLEVLKELLTSIDEKVSGSGSGEISDNIYMSVDSGTQTKSVTGKGDCYLYYYGSVQPTVTLDGKTLDLSFLLNFRILDSTNRFIIPFKKSISISGTSWSANIVFKE